MGHYRGICTISLYDQSLNCPIVVVCWKASQTSSCAVQKLGISTRWTSSRCSFSLKLTVIGTSHPSSEEDEALWGLLASSLAEKTRTTGSDRNLASKEQRRVIVKSLLMYTDACTLYTCAYIHKQSTKPKESGIWSAQGWQEQKEYA